MIEDGTCQGILDSPIPVELNLTCLGVLCIPLSDDECQAVNNVYSITLNNLKETIFLYSRPSIQTSLRSTLLVPSQSSNLFNIIRTRLLYSIQFTPTYLPFQTPPHPQPNPTMKSPFILFSTLLLSSTIILQQQVCANPLPSPDDSLPSGDQSPQVQW